MVPQDPINPLRSTLPRYCSMEAGGLLFISSARFFIKKKERGGGIDLSNAYSVVPAWPH